MTRPSRSTNENAGREWHREPAQIKSYQARHYYRVFEPAGNPNEALKTCSTNRF